MKKWIFSLSVLASVSFTSFEAPHQHMISTDLAHAPKAFARTDAKYLAPESVQTGYLFVKPMKVTGFDTTSRTKMDKAFEVLEKVVNSEEFKTRVINFKNDSGQRAFASNTGKTNEEIFEIFMSGEETLQPGTTGEMNFYLSLYNARFSKVIGWTNPTINTININWKFFKNFTAAEVAGNLAHEWTHKIGFDHKSAAEHDSAPYAVGYIVRDMGARYLKGEVLH